MDGGILNSTASQFLGVVLVGAALAKLIHWNEFRGVVGSYRLLPAPLVTPFAWALPPVEVAVGASLALHVAAPWAASVAAGLFSLFAFAMAVNLARGRSYIDCGCFQSALRQAIDWRLVARNGGLAVLSLAVAATSSVPPEATAVWLTTLPAAAVFYALYLALNSVWALDESFRNAFPRSFV
jgi:hypothetical protein